MLQVGNPYCLEGAVSKDYDTNFAKEATNSDLLYLKLKFNSLALGLAICRESRRAFKATRP